MKVKLLSKLSIKLVLVISVVLIIVFALNTYVAIKYLEDELTEIHKQSAFSASDLIKSSTRHSMLHNNREDIYNTIRTIGNEPGFLKVRIFNKQGVISFSSDSSEIGKEVDMNNESCIACHTSAGRKNVDSKELFRSFFVSADERAVGLINPIKNETDCYTSDCHAHSKSVGMLGVLDVVVSMKKADLSISSTKKTIIINFIIITLIISSISGTFIYVLINKPLKRVSFGIDELGRGNWNYRIPVRERDEVGIISKQFNDMSRKLSSAYNEIKEWSETLNIKVEEKTQELKTIYEQIVQMEKLASLGKLSATVAHELNNPLEGILTYSKLVSKKLKKENSNEKLTEYLDLISDEAARCGRIVKDMLIFSHSDKEEFNVCNITGIIEKSIKLINHHLEINNIKLNRNFESEDICISCSGQKIQQALMSLFINAIESMQSKGEGTITITTRRVNEYIEIKISDTGSGIDAKDLPHIFDPFYTTKDAGKGTGLGLSVVYGIINTHKGKIEVEETSINGTTFNILLPIEINKEDNEKI